MGQPVLRSARVAAVASAMILAALGAAATTEAAWAGGRPHAMPQKGLLRVNHLAPAGFTPRAVRAMPLRVPHPAVYAAQKEAANVAAARLAARESRPGAAALAPSLLRKWAGQRDTTTAPSDSTGAIGTARYIELVNSKAAVYSRTSNTPLASGPLTNVTGCVTTLCTESVFDPQII